MSPIGGLAASHLSRTHLRALPANLAGSCSSFVVRRIPAMRYSLKQKCCLFDTRRNTPPVKRHACYSDVIIITFSTIERTSSGSTSSAYLRSGYESTLPKLTFAKLTSKRCVGYMGPINTRSCIQGNKLEIDEIVTNRLYHRSSWLS